MAIHELLFQVTLLGACAFAVFGYVFEDITNKRVCYILFVLLIGFAIGIAVGEVFRGWTIVNISV